MGKPLLAVIRDLALDPAEKAAFETAPADYLGRHGHEGVTPDDLREAVSLAADTMDPEVAQAIAPPEGGDADVLETLQRVTNAAPGPAPDEAPGGPETPAETTGSDLAFGSGSSVDGIDDADGVDQGIELIDDGEMAHPEDDAEDLVFDRGPLTDDALPEDELGGLDDGGLQSADDFANDLQDADVDVGDMPDVGAF